MPLSTSAIHGEKRERKKKSISGLGRKTFREGTTRSVPARTTALALMWEFLDLQDVHRGRTLKARSFARLVSRPTHVE